MANGVMQKAVKLCLCLILLHPKKLDELHIAFKKKAAARVVAGHKAKVAISHRTALVHPK